MRSPFQSIFRTGNSRMEKVPKSIEKGGSRGLWPTFWEGKTSLAAGVNASRLWPFDTILISMLLEQEKVPAQWSKDCFVREDSENLRRYQLRETILFFYPFCNLLKKCQTFSHFLRGFQGMPINSESDDNKNPNRNNGKNVHLCPPLRHDPTMERPTCLPRVPNIAITLHRR